MTHSDHPRISYSQEESSVMVMRLRSENGITLIEALASTVILGIVIIAFINISNYSLLANNKSDQEAKVQRIAQKQLNFVRDHILRNNGALPATPAEEGYTVFIQLTDFNSSVAPTYNPSTLTDNKYSLQAIVQINKIPKLLTVTISWSDTP